MQYNADRQTIVLDTKMDALDGSLTSRLLKTRQAYQAGDQLSFILHNDVEHQNGTNLAFGLSLNWIVICTVILGVVALGVGVTLTVMHRRQLT